VRRRFRFRFLFLFGLASVPFGSGRVWRDPRTFPKRTKNGDLIKDFRKEKNGHIKCLPEISDKNSTQMSMIRDTLIPVECHDEIDRRTNDNSLVRSPFPCAMCGKRTAACDMLELETGAVCKWCHRLDISWHERKPIFLFHELKDPIGSWEAQPEGIQRLNEYHRLSSADFSIAGQWKFPQTKKLEKM
jgi:hypothetical protein